MYVFIIVQSCAIIKVYLTSRLHKVLCGTATFWVSYFLRASTF